MKMRYYRLTESRIKRIIRHPARIEEGILENAVAVMQPADGKTYSEIWTMYILAKDKSRKTPHQSKFGAEQVKDKSSKIKIITAWRYPGRSPERDPVPEEVLREIRKLL